MLMNLLMDVGASPLEHLDMMQDTFVAYNARRITRMVFGRMDSVSDNM